MFHDSPASSPRGQTLPQHRNRGLDRLVAPVAGTRDQQRRKGSLFATWQLLFTHLVRREDVVAMAGDLFAVVASGAVKIPVHARLPLDQAAEAHRRLEARETTGATILLSA